MCFNKSSDFNNSKVGTQTITYTVTDSWGKSSTAQMNLIVIIKQSN